MKPRHRERLPRWGWAIIALGAFSALVLMVFTVLAFYM
jgi:hypothetical protein